MFDRASLRVLIIDDDAILRAVLRKFLEGHGVTAVVEAADGDEAFAVLSREAREFGLIFCDLQMPGRDGIDLLRSMKDVAQGSAIVFLSGEDERVLSSVAALARAKGLPVLSTMTKPITANMVREVLVALHTIPTMPVPVPAPPRPSLTPEQVHTVMTLNALEMHYQPKIHVKDRSIAGFEALLRAVHPELGLLPTEAFIDVAEAEGYTDRIAAWSVSEGIAAAARWAAAGIDAGVAINLSGRALGQLDLPDLVGTGAAAAGVPNEKITLEITETQLPADPEAAVDITTRLRLKRFHVSIDDFGIGVSGMRQLQQMPFTELKLDRKFVDRCDTVSANRSIVQAGISLARSLGMRVVAEGIEREEEWTLLAELGCDIAQGYWVARAMPEETIAEWSAEWMARR